MSTTPDVTFDDPDDDEMKVFIYLDGLSGHLHGNPETRDRDMQIRSQLRSEGHTVLEITAHDLDDEQQMIRHFRRLARVLIGRDAANRLASDPKSWCFPHRPATRNDEGPPSGVRMIDLPFFPDLRIACGLFREGNLDYEQQTMSLPDPGNRLDPARHFIVRAEGNSMDGGNAPIRDGDYVLLERLDADHAGSLTGYGRPWAVEYRDDTGDTAYALKMIARADSGRYQLLSKNPDYPPVPVDPDTVFPFARFLDMVEPDIKRHHHLGKEQ